MSKIEPEIIKDITEKCLIIKIRQDFIDKHNGDIYEASRHEWRLSAKNALKVEYALIVLNGVVKTVYTDLTWYPENLRLTFEGITAPKSILDKYMGKRIPLNYVKDRGKNPCRYVNIDNK